MINFNKKITDVLVVGGGSAGLCSAINARMLSNDVTLLYKAGGNCTSIAAGGYAAVFDGNPYNDSVEAHIKDTLECGNNLSNPELVDILAENASEAIAQISGWGVEFYKNPDDTFRMFRSGGHTYPRSLRCKSGRGAESFGVMFSKCGELGVDMQKNFTLWGLLYKEGRCFGGAGIASDGTPTVIYAKSVILASGGFGALYSNTTNPKGVRGECLQMAYDAGATLIDMEFVQFMPTTFAYPISMQGKIINDTLRGEGALLYNSNMERFMANYDPKAMEVATRDILSVAITSEIASGRGSKHGGVYLDARHIEEKAMLESFTYAKEVAKKGVDPQKQMLEVYPASHFTCGGIKIDGKCQTGVDGLFAVGEATGGVHGANRLGSNALTENVVFSRIAAKSASDYAKSKTNDFPPNLHERFVDMLSDVSENETEQAEQMIASATKQIGEIMWEKVGIIRNGIDLQNAQNQLEELAHCLKKGQGIKGSALQKVKLESLFLQSTLGANVAKSAYARGQSIGSHFRSDATN